MRTDLPANRCLARDIQILERVYGAQHIQWSRKGAWVQVDHFPIRSARFRLSMPATYLLILVPPDYGERRGEGSGLEEFYCHKNLRILNDGVWQDIPHTYLQHDRRNGAANRLEHRYACVHINWDPARHTVVDSLKLLRLMFADPFAFSTLAGRS